MVSFVPMSIVNQSAVKIVDVAGQEHNVTVVQRETGFIARSTLVDEPGRSPVSADEAVQRLLVAINHNHPKQFECMEPEKQAQLLGWIRLHLRKGSKGNVKRWGSHQLAQVVGHAVGFYVGNGELKGAMRAAGLVPTEGYIEYSSHWNFILERKSALWSFAWRSVSYKMKNANVSHYISLLNSFRLWWFSGCSRPLSSLNSDLVGAPTGIESYLPTQDNLLSKPFNNLADIAVSSNTNPAR
jgi:hypothetical protein